MTKNIWLDFFINAGCSCIPLKKNDKKPAIKWKKYTEEKLSKEEIQRLLDREDSKNIGVICGEISNNLLVIDLDNAELFEKLNLGELASKTLTVRTAKGFHHYLRFDDADVKELNVWIGEKGVKTLWYPPSKKKGEEEPKEEIRFQWNDHYVVGPSSIHPSGAHYEHFITSPKKIAKAKGIGLLEEIERRWITFHKIKKKRDKLIEEPLLDFIKKYSKPEEVTDEGDRIRLRCPFPFHQDTTPSFNIYKADNHWYCYGCENGGRHVEFLMHFKGITRAQAIAELGVQPSKRRKKDGEEEERRYETFVCNNGIIAEEVYRDDKLQFVVFDSNSGTWEYKTEIEVDGEKIYPLPILDGQKNSLIIPDGVEEYRSLKELRDEMLAFALETFDPVDNIELFELMIHLFLTSWIAGERMKPMAERFIPIVAIRGPSETGKKRFLTIARWLTYRSMYALKTTKVPTLFRSISKWGGTLVLDEADLADTSERSEFIEFMNSRADGVPIPRYNSGTKEVEYFYSFGMSVLAERSSAADDGYESRKIIFPSDATQYPEKYPLIPDKEWVEKGKVLQRKLLLFRLKHLTGEVPTNLIIEGIKGFRVRESLLLIQTLGEEDEEIKKNIEKIAKKLEERIIIERSASMEGIILNSVYNAIMDDNAEITEFRNAIEIVRSYSGRNPEEGTHFVPVTLKTIAKTIGEVMSSSEVARRWRGLGQGVRSRGRIDGRLYSGIIQITNTKRFLKELEKYVVDIDYNELREKGIIMEKQQKIGIEEETK